MVSTAARDLRGAPSRSEVQVGIRAAWPHRPGSAAATAAGSRTSVCLVLMGDPAPVGVSGPRTLVRQCPSTRIPSPSPAAAAACLATTGPPAFRHAPRRASPVPSGTTGIAPRPARCVAPRSIRRHAGFPGIARFRACGFLAVGGSAPIRALPRMWRTVPCDASTAYAAALQHGTGSSPCVTPSRRALPSRHVAFSDQVMRGTLAPRHHAGTKFLVTETLAATGPEANSAPRHYRFSVPGNLPPRPQPMIANPAVVTGAPNHTGEYALNFPAAATTLRRIDLGMVQRHRSALFDLLLAAGTVSYSGLAVNSAKVVHTG